MTFLIVIYVGFFDFKVTLHLYCHQHCLHCIVRSYANFHTVYALVKYFLYDRTQIVYQLGWKATAQDLLLDLSIQKAFLDKPQ